MIKAPYNFVPLASRVYYPKWADKISHGVPFKNGVSGCIDITITAETPLFVKDSEAKAGNSDYPFRTTDGKYFIPGTSVKGCVRSVLEILSFGKMEVDKDSAFAQREWTNSALYPLKSKQNAIMCGWLRRKEGKYLISKCAEPPMRINLKRIDEWLEEPIFENVYSSKIGDDLNNELVLNEMSYDRKTAACKYALLANAGVSIEELKGLNFSEDNEYSTELSTRYMICDDGIKGTLVFTGQPDLAKNWNESRAGKTKAGKFYEFIFSEEQSGEEPISENLFKNYESIYYESPDWAFWKPELDKGGIPVFFRMENNRIKDFGLAFLYKLPYEQTPYEIEAKRQENQKPDGRELDMAECIFGHVINKNDFDSLKGRVQFSHFYSENAELDEQYILVLNGPKASYYPIYIEQKNGNRGKVSGSYNTYNDGRLAGRKRYVVRNGVWGAKNENDYNEKIDSMINPLRAGSEFKGQVRFHNLRPEELGALLAALTFFDTEECRHQIGQAKPYGFGRVKVDLSIPKLEDNSDRPVDANKAMALFEKDLKDEGFNLVSATSVQQLLTLASTPITDHSMFEYMVLNMEGRNDFEAAKVAKEYLLAFSGICNKFVCPKSKLDDFDPNGDDKKYEQLDALRQRINLYLEINDKKNALELCNEAILLAEELVVDHMDLDKIKADCEASLNQKKLTFKDLPDLLDKKYKSEFDKIMRDKGFVMDEDEYKSWVSDLKKRNPKVIKSILRESQFIKKQSKEFQKKLKNDLKK